MCSTKNNITIHIFGKPYNVPPNITIISAMEYVGLVPIHECGCRGGFCGTCTVIVKKGRNAKEEFALACRTTVYDGIYVERLSKSKHINHDFRISDIGPDTDCIIQMYPEINMCIGCGLCSKLCPNGIDVKKCITYIKNGKINKCAKTSLGCTMCEICSIRCPARINLAQAMLTSRRINGRFLVTACEHIQKPINEMQKKMYSNDMNTLIALSDDEIRSLYSRREIEK